jgi:hypothetical protein
MDLFIACEIFAGAGRKQLSPAKILTRVLKVFPVDIPFRPDPAGASTSRILQCGEKKFVQPSCLS